jgi:hypothetical protein
MAAPHPVPPAGMHITWVHKVKTRGFPGFPKNLGFLGSKPEPKQALVYVRTLLYNYRQLGRRGNVHVRYDRIKVPYSIVQIWLDTVAY